MFRENKTTTKFYILELLDEFINHPKNEHRLVSISLGADEPVLTKLLGDYDALQIQRENELSTTNKNDISIKEIDSRLKKHRAKINDALKDIRKDLELKINRS